MKNIITFIKHELHESLYPFIFFFILFHLTVLTKMLMLKSYGLTGGSVEVATVGALIVAKAVLVADSMSLTHRFGTHPLIYSVLWKTVVYGAFVLLFRCLEEFVPLWIKHPTLGVAYAHVRSDVSWPMFWAIQIWVSVGLLLYNSLREMDRYFGTGSMKKAFLGQ